ncbi:Citrinin resistance protein, mitochondrial [Nakaseomyces bracarensis]|uniref:Citrinin resistance protein, mitochondrial n=1 Tax=Nakaseomyces bracarensis TaxID=273131 RepID=A0ABR4NU64_9SACH
MVFEPVSLTVYDRNIWHLFKKGPAVGETPQAMFPTNIRYIFDDDEDISIPTPSNNGINMTNEADGVENVIILNIDEKGDLENVELISDNYEMLSYRKSRPVNLAESRSLSRFSEVTPDNDNDKGVGVAHRQPMRVELELVSEFKDYTAMSLDDLKLDELTRIFSIQNKQLQTISDSLLN